MRHLAGRVWALAPLLRQRSVARFTLLLAILALCGLSMLLLPQPDLADAPRLVDRLGPLAPPAAVLLGAVMMVVLVPRTLVSFAWGALFGTVGGASYALAAALLAALLGFTVGRLLGRAFVAERVRGRLARLDGWFARQSVLGVVTVRLLPVGGFGLISYGYGTTGARLRPFLIGSVLASVPSAFGYAAMGAAVASPGDINWFAIAPAGLGLVATTIIVTKWRRSARARAAEAAAA
ncbi:TVP38/TMEM64 family protein [Phytohabitans kaempferiae]|uniref:TVP38/TMEM64 family membrane protein n=1 Tax=Phytohabitans kaempferiae TaxID=1620943 RepID=A0ABV6M2T1_9ACTN